MASATQPNQCQVPACCDFCEIETKIDWKCLNCDVLMCTKCKDKVHSKLKFAKDHKIIGTKEVGLHPKEPDFSNIRCQEHLGQVCFMFCKSCDLLVCPQCIAKVHNGHGLDEIKAGYDGHLERLKERQRLVEQKLEKLNNRQGQINEMKKAEVYKYTEAKNLIQTQNKALKKAIDQYTEKLLKELDNKWESINKVFENEELAWFQLKTHVDHHKTKTEETINSMDLEGILRESKNLHDLEKSLKDSAEQNLITYNSIPKFITGEIAECNFGFLKDITKDIKMKVIKQFTADISTVYHLATTSDGSLWMSNHLEVCKVKPEGNKLKVMKTYDLKTFDIAVTESDNLLIASDVIKEIKFHTGELTDSTYSVSPLSPTAIHITKDCKVLVGAKSPGVPWPASGRRIIVKMNKSGKEENIYEKDKKGKSIFTYPESITTTRSGTMLVVDRLSQDGRGRVVVLGLDDDVVLIYDGHPEINTEDKPFHPVSIATTPSDNIMVQDYRASYFHFLNSIGQLISSINAKDIGLVYPYSLCYTPFKQLLIGCATSGEKAKVYEATLTEA